MTVNVSYFQPFVCFFYRQRIFYDIKSKCPWCSVIQFIIRGCLSCFLSLIFSAKPPKITSQPTSQKDAIPGKAVAFSVQATGMEPLGYQWQWKPFGKKDEEDGWQNLSGEGSKFQVRSVKASNAGYYRCVVSNSAGSETSQCASLTVGRHVPIVSTSLSTHSQMNVFSVLSSWSTWPW